MPGLISKNFSLIGVGRKPALTSILFKSSQVTLKCKQGWDQGARRREIAEKFWEKLEVQEWKPNLVSFFHSVQFNKNLYHLYQDSESNFWVWKWLSHPERRLFFCWLNSNGVQKRKKRKSIVWKIWNQGFPGGASRKEHTYQCRRLKRHGFNPWVRKIFWRRKWQSTSIFLPGESHGLRSHAGYNLWGHKGLHTTE